ncbi:hypothetical protein BS50DRAFT_328572 [Corynespora cassiicola Philippines]|uniref:Uncharacterized protein n=1 Tax=Corynespora cassiicola Philippines TaxID=1448308 RepID=A0A2T2NU67_CORCC|nr:hypothetical protein BS50DRAFT_328572 [Corynespora cassiicola Philippines]
MRPGEAWSASRGGLAARPGQAGLHRRSALPRGSQGGRTGQEKPWGVLARSSRRADASCHGQFDEGRASKGCWRPATTMLDDEGGPTWTAGPRQRINSSAAAAMRRAALRGSVSGCIRMCGCGAGVLQAARAGLEAGGWRL